MPKMWQHWLFVSGFLIIPTPGPVRVKIPWSVLAELVLGKAILACEVQELLMNVGGSLSWNA
jgi:hypothetical protein